MAGKWNFGMPARGSDLVKRHRITVRRGGKDWNGHWEIDGDRLIVSSAYGSRTGKAEPEATQAARAETLFGEILAERG